jgi:pSer/pThr/pTyr-binding forkhead associated (FHA) protein
MTYKGFESDRQAKVMKYKEMLPMVLFAQLDITKADRSERCVAVNDIATIGRDNDNDIVLRSMTVSRCHALLLRDADQLLLLDLESTNGTLVNGVAARPDTPIRLADGDSIQFGQVVARYRRLNLPPVYGDQE